MESLVAVFFIIFVVYNVIGYNNDFMVTPFGIRHKNCVHVVEPGSHIINNDEEYFTIIHDKLNINKKIKRCSGNMTGIDVTFGEGWQAYAQQNVGAELSADIDSFLGNWTVPPLPTKATEIEVLYTFTGLQNNDWVPPEIPPFGPFDIIQPVLGYGKRSATGGGAFWSIASWYVTLSDDVIQSKIVKVNPGDIIFGNMTKVNDNGTWYIDSVNMNTNEHTDFTVSRSILAKQQYLFVTLEVYDIWACNEYPLQSTIPYTNLYATANGKPIDFNWTIYSNPLTPPICNESLGVDNEDGTKMSIYF